MSARNATERRLPISPRHPLYPVLAVIALAGLIFGPVGRQAGSDVPESKSHPYFPDHFWPYPILAMAVLVTLGLLAVFGQAVLQLGAAADPRAYVAPRPEWYFLALFQFAKLGPALLTTIVVPTLLVVGWLFWPLLDSGLGPRVARWLGWSSWPAPRRNAITAAIWMAVLLVIGLLTLWSAFAPELCIPWPVNGPVCGS